MQKMESVIWNYLDYNAQTHKSKCCIVDAQTAKDCSTFCWENWHGMSCGISDRRASFI